MDGYGNLTCFDLGQPIIISGLLVPDAVVGSSRAVLLLFGFLCEVPLCLSFFFRVWEVSVLAGLVIMFCDCPC